MSEAEEKKRAESAWTWHAHKHYKARGQRAEGHARESGLAKILEMRFRDFRKRMDLACTQTLQVTHFKSHMTFVYYRLRDVSEKEKRIDSVSAAMPSG